jgi:hypothetical protein
MPLDFFLRGNVKDQVYDNRVNMMDKLKAQITAATVNIKRIGYNASAKRRTLGEVHAQI